MKNLKILMLCLVLISLHAHAGLPDGTNLDTKKSLSFDIKLSTLSLVSHKNLQQKAPSLIFNTKSLDAGYVSGLQKKTEMSSVEGLLNWDFKVKFRLNRNMNIIFSYN